MPLSIACADSPMCLGSAGRHPKLAINPGPDHHRAFHLYRPHMAGQSGELSASCHTVYIVGTPSLCHTPNLPSYRRISANNWPVACRRALCMQAIVHGNSMFESSQSLPDPAARLVGAIPDCTTNLFLTHDCLDFVYAPNSIPAVNVRTAMPLATPILNGYRQAHVCRFMCILDSTSVSSFVCRT